MLRTCFLYPLAPKYPHEADKGLKDAKGSTATHEPNDMAYRVRRGGRGGGAVGFVCSFRNGLLWILRGSHGSSEFRIWGQVPPRGTLEGWGNSETRCFRRGSRWCEGQRAEHLLEQMFACFFFPVTLYKLSVFSSNDCGPFDRMGFLKKAWSLWL